MNNLYFMVSYINRKKMETNLIDFYNNYGIQFSLDNCHTFEELVNNFDNIIPQIEFDDNKSLIDTLKENYIHIGKLSTAFTSTFHPCYIFDFITSPDKFHISHNRTGINFLEGFLRQQGSINTQIFYCIIFMIEVLNREDDAISSKNARIPLRYQIYYETYIIDTIFAYYYHDYEISFRFNFMASSIDSNNISNDFKDEINQVTQKFISLVEYHFCRIKDKLLEKCINEDITPSRTLWLCFVPLTYDEISNILIKIKNKYIRCSLFYVAGFQNIVNIRNLSKLEIENVAFDNGLQIKNYINYKKSNNKNDFIFEKYNLVETHKFKYFHFNESNNDKMNYYLQNNKLISKMNVEEYNDFISNVEYQRDEIYTFHPFYIYSHSTVFRNWKVGFSLHIKYIDQIFSIIESEYKNYYQNNNSKRNHYFQENENIELISFKSYEVISKI